ncbi:MAG: tetratricopeptide repeat protein [Bacteroidota bacterium]
MGEDLIEKRLQRAYYLAELQRYEACFKELEAILALEPTHRLALRFYLECKINSEANEDAIKDLVERLLQLSAQEGLGHFAIGLVHRQRFQLDQAKACFQQALHLEPRNVDYILELTMTHWMANEYAEAKALLSKALELDPESAKVLSYQSYFELDSFQHNKAQAAIEVALQKDPMAWELHAQRGAIALAKMDHKVAEQHYAEAIRLNPHDVELRANYLTSRLADFWPIRLVASKYWLLNGVPLALRPLPFVIFLMMLLFFKTEIPSGSWGYFLLGAYLLLIGLINAIEWFLLPVLQYWKSKQTWKQYYAPWWSLRHYIILTMQLAGLGGVYFWWTDDFRGITTGFFLCWYGILGSLLFIETHQRIRKIFTFLLIGVYLLGVLNLCLDLAGMVFKPTQMVVAFAWLIPLVLGDWLKRVLPDQNANKDLDSNRRS